MTDELGRLQDIQYWNPVSGQWQTTVPTFPVGHWGGLSCRGVNLSSTDQWLALRFYSYGPDGALRNQWTSSYYLQKPGEGLSGNNAVYCDIPGDYSQKCELLIAGVGIVDTVQRVICHATAAPAAFATISAWRFWDPLKVEWVSLPPSLIPLGNYIGIQVQGWNRSEVSLNLRADVKHTSPSGKTATLTGGVSTIAPSAWQYIGDFLWAGDEAGIWECGITLYAALPGQPLAEVDSRGNIEVAYVGVIEPPESGFQEFAVASFNRG